MAPLEEDGGGPPLQKLGALNTLKCVRVTKAVQDPKEEREQQPEEEEQEQKQQTDREEL